MSAVALATQAGERARIRRATLAAHRSVEKLDAASAKELEALYRQAGDELRARIRAAGGGDDTIVLAELQSLLEQVNAQLALLARARNGLLDRAVGQAIDLGLQPFAIEAQAAVRINRDALSFIRTFVAEDGLQLSDRIWRIDRGARDRVVNAIEQAVIQGQGAAQAAREFLSRGQPVPLEVQDKRQAGQASNVARLAGEALLNGNGAPMDNALRLFRTEINRAHGEAYMKGGADHPDFGGWRYLLSPAHPKPDICDLLSTQNLHGLGPGVYPTREQTPWPAHPNTLSFIEIVFADEISAADRAGKETPLQALQRLAPAQRIGVLGVGKHEIFKAGALKQGMIRAPLAAVKKRVGLVTIERRPPPPPPAIAPRPRPAREPELRTLDEFIGWGNGKATELVSRARLAGKPLGEALGELILADLSGSRAINAAAKVRPWTGPSGERGAALVRTASQRFPDAWTAKADVHGPLYAIARAGRGFQYSAPASYQGRAVKLGEFGRVTLQSGQGYIKAAELSTAVHEYAHRLQAALPELDDLFQALHHRRTEGAPLKPLRAITGSAYKSGEVTREDRYVNPYQGKVYGPRVGYTGKHGALEVMTMAFEDVLGGQPGRLERVVEADREMFNLVLGLLYRYNP